MRAVIPFSVPCTDPVIYERNVTVWLFIYLNIFILYISYVSVIDHFFLFFHFRHFFLFRKINNGSINLQKHSESSMQEHSENIDNT